jgi:hypothetical protein
VPPSDRITFSEVVRHVATIAKVGLDNATNKLLRRALVRQELECTCEELRSWAGDDLQGGGNSERNVILPAEFFDRAHFGVDGKGGHTEKDIATLRHLKLPYSVSPSDWEAGRRGGQGGNFAKGSESWVAWHGYYERTDKAKAWMMENSRWPEWFETTSMSPDLNP